MSTIVLNLTKKQKSNVLVRKNLMKKKIIFLVASNKNRDLKMMCRSSQNPVCAQNIIRLPIYIFRSANAIVMFAQVVGIQL